jgi:hypothetical protein
MCSSVIGHRVGNTVGRVSSVGIATRYGLDGPGVESCRGLKHPPPSTAKVEERVQLYLYSASGPLCPVLG